MKIKKLIGFVGLIGLAGNTMATVLANNEEVHKKNEVKASVEKELSSSCLVDESALEDIKKSKQQNENKAKELAVKETELKAREQALSEQLKNLEKIREEISQIKKEKNKEADQKIAQLTETVLTMSPKAAAKMLSALDEKLSVEIMLKMDTQRLAKIMNLMDSSHSSKLSELMAGNVSKGSESQNGSNINGRKPTNAESQAVKPGQPAPVDGERDKRQK